MEETSIFIDPESQEVPESSKNIQTNSIKNILGINIKPIYILFIILLIAISIGIGFIYYYFIRENNKTKKKTNINNNNNTKNTKNKLNDNKYDLINYNLTIKNKNKLKYILTIFYKNIDNNIKHLKKYSTNYELIQLFISLKKQLKQTKTVQNIQTHMQKLYRIDKKINKILKKDPTILTRTY